MRFELLAVYVLLACMIQGHAAFNLHWRTPAVSLDANPPLGDSDLNAKIVMDSSGNAIATWSRTVGHGAIEEVWVSVYHHASRVWSGAVKISGKGNASNGTVAVDLAGNAILVWEEGFPSQIFSRTLSANGVWSPPLGSPGEPIQSSFYSQIMPRLATDAEGNSVALWVEEVGEGNRVRAARKPNGLKWIDCITLSSSKKNGALAPGASVVLNDAGVGFGVWEETEIGSSQSKIYGARFAEGKWGASFPVSLEAGSQAPSVAVDAQGNGVIAWSQGDAVHSKFWKEGRLSQDTLLISDPHWIAKRPSLGMDRAGNAVVVFERYDVQPGSAPLNLFISTATLLKGADTWSSPSDISGPSASPGSVRGAGYPVLSVNGIGDAVAVWKEYNGKNLVVQGAGYSLGTWSLHQTLSSGTARVGSEIPSYDLGVAINLAGNTIAIWPEDSSGMNAPQIKAVLGAGVAIEGPRPPVVLTEDLALFASQKTSSSKIDAANLVFYGDGVAVGEQILHRFPAHADLINVLKWGSPGGVACYKIYRGDLSNLIGMTQSTCYKDHGRVPKKAETYLVTAVDQNGQESVPITIFVSPL